MLHVLALAVLAPAQLVPPQSPGFGDAAAANARKVTLLKNVTTELENSMAPFFGKAAIPELRKRIAALTASAPAQSAASMHLTLADVLLGFGQVDEAIAEYEASIEATRPLGDARALAIAQRKLAVAWMRMGERQNCVARHNEESCIFPLKGGAIHVDRRGSETAIEVLLAALQSDPGDLASIWLLNVAHMTLGSWPDGVPEAWRIAPSAFESERPMPRMREIAGRLGMASMTRSGGSILDDFDGDGQLEVVTSSIDLHQSIRMFRRQQDGTWQDVAPKLGLAPQVGGFQILQFDADNDGRLDLLIQRGGWLGDFGHVPNSLVMQQKDGTFVDRTREAGMEYLAPSQVVAADDVDLDGDLDVFLGYENSGGERAIRFPCRLLRNRGDGTFEEIGRQAGVVNGLVTKGAAFGDYDGDGRPDLYVSNMHGPNRLYHNEGDCRFKDVAAELGVRAPLDSFACWFFDENNDGWLDLFVGCYDVGDRGSQVGAYYKDGVVPTQTQRLYENDGHGGFRDVTVERRLNRVVFPMGANFGDVDNDGFPDIYLATGDPELSSLWPNILYRNDGGRRFEDVTTATGTGHLQKGHGVSFGDLDGDGDQDLFVQLGGAADDDGFGDVLFENPGHGNRWITVRLIGRSSNRFGVGSRIRATIEEGPSGPNGESSAATRDVFHFVGSNSSFGGNSLQAEMGLGKATRLVALEVYWPKTRKTQRFADVPLDRVVVVDEGKEQLAVLPAASAPLR